MALNKLLHQWFAHWCSKIHVLESVKAGARVELAGFIIIIRQLNKRLVYVYGNSSWVGRNAATATAAAASAMIPCVSVIEAAIATS